jgi:hypothetical protein
MARIYTIKGKKYQIGDPFKHDGKWWIIRDYCRGCKILRLQRVEVFNEALKLK